VRGGKLWKGKNWEKKRQGIPRRVETIRERKRSCKEGKKLRVGGKGVRTERRKLKSGVHCSVKEGRLKKARKKRQRIS